MILQKEGDIMEKIKKLSLGLIVVMILVLSFGCGQKEQDQTKITVHTNLGFVSKLSQEDGKNYVEFSFNGDDGNLKLQVDDIDIFNDIEEDEFYRFAFNGYHDLLLSLDKDNYIKSLVLKSMEEGIEPSDSEPISLSEKTSTEGLVLLDSYDFDINGDGIEETIAMYVNAEQSSNGEIYWDDGQDWLFLVEGKEEDYVLFNDYVQLGTIKFHIYTEDDDFYITTVQSGTANLDIVEYRFDPESKQFISSLLHGTRGNVNMLHSCYGY